MLTIIGGKYRNRKIVVPQGKQVRPMTNRVKESVFNVLENLIHFSEWKVVDLYAGTGNLGLEALSRGAQHCIFVEKSPKVARLLRQNLGELKVASEETAIWHLAATSWLRQAPVTTEPILVLANPPYYIDEYDKLLPLLAEAESIAVGSVMMIEAPVKITLNIPDNLEVLKEKTYGQTQIVFVEKHAP